MRIGKGKNVRKGTKGFVETPKTIPVPPTIGAEPIIKVDGNKLIDHTDRDRLLMLVEMYVKSREVYLLNPPKFNNMQLEKKLEKEYEKLEELIKNIKETNEKKMVEFQKRENSQLEVLLNENQGFSNIFFRRQLKNKSYKNIMSQYVETKKEEKLMTNRIYKAHKENTSFLVNQFNDGIGYRLYDSNSASSTSSDDDYERDRRNHNPGGGARGTF